MEEPSPQSYEYFVREVYDCDQPRGGATMIEVRAVLGRRSIATTISPITPHTSQRIVVAQMIDG
jgi:hypothetical protein